MELPIRILPSGTNLKMEVTKYEIQGHKLSDTSIQAVCSKLINHQDIAAVRNTLSNCQEILICAREAIKNETITLDVANSNETWKVKLEKRDNTTLTFQDPAHRTILADLYQRRLEKSISRFGKYWRTSDSNSIFYDEKPFSTNNEFEAYRSFKVSRVIDDVGIGFSLTIGTIFLTELWVGDFYAAGRHRDLDMLLQRSNELKGTMLFFGPNIVNKVYYSRACTEYTCGTVPRFAVKGRDFNNLVDYYSEYPHYAIQPTDSVAYVSFQNLGSPRPVPAKKLKARIFNDALPGVMKRLDKISTEERRRLTIAFWNSLGNILREPFETLSSEYFFKPAVEKQGTIRMPNLKFGKNQHGHHQVLPMPQRFSAADYKTNFKERKKYLDCYGCFRVPPTVEQEIHFSFPKNVSTDTQNLFVNDMCRKLTTLVGRELSSQIRPYEHYIQAASKLKAEKETGMVIFVFDNAKPATYYGISRELADWSIKRITSRELNKKFSDREKAKKWKQEHCERQQMKEERDWDSFIDQCAYDTIQQLGCIPWTIDGELNYDLQLAIDVSADYTHFALSLMVFNTKHGYPIFKTETERKLDQYMETINPEDLKEGIRELFNDPLIRQLKNQGYLKSMLVYRDGKDCQGEFDVINAIIPELQKERKLQENFKFDFALVRKHLTNGLRGWIKESEGSHNVLEGSYWLRTKKSALLWTTGNGTVSEHATAEPIEIEMKHTSGSLLLVMEDLFHTAQLNYSSPTKAQKLSLPLKRSDEKLKEKRSEELKLK